jgi:uncharacterized metal-binding protein YceD (DUF177 family)
VTGEHREFSRPVPLAKLDAGAYVAELVARPEERAALARRFDLVSLDEFKASVRLFREPGGIRLEAEFGAALTQICGVSLEPFASRVSDRFTLLYRKAAPTSEPAPEEEDWEPIPAEAIDLGEAVAQQLSLVLDPFPRAPGAELAAELGAAPVESAGCEGEPHPFAALARLAKK